MKTVEKRMAIERKVVRHLVRAMKAAGWLVKQVDDGGDDYIPVSTETEVMEAVFAVDEAQIMFCKDGDKYHWVMIVLGNDGWDCIADYGYSETDDFDEVMKRDVDPYCEGLQVQ